eukprot:TRINITY_DN6499_c0_g1_i1.p1 TRINITY_DN6499_c0_g1~~TRINITY_DN6499_c0_g1_i1.p1  ORF type:complete len:263 (+),score=68.45 TRINITY_DN6499_c0_g1_i1:31-819(+)
MKTKAFTPIFLTVLAIGLFLVSISIPIHVYFRPVNWNQDKPDTGKLVAFNDSVAYLNGNLAPEVLYSFRWDVQLKYFEGSPRGLDICNNNSSYRLNVYVKNGNVLPETNNYDRLIKFDPSSKNCTQIRSCGGSVFLGFYIPDQVENSIDLDVNGVMDEQGKISAPNLMKYSVKLTEIEKVDGSCRLLEEKFSKKDVIALILWMVATMLASVGCCLAWGFYKRKKSRMPRTYSKFTTFMEDPDSNSSDSDSETEEFIDPASRR